MALRGRSRDGRSARPTWGWSGYPRLSLRADGGGAAPAGCSRGRGGCGGGGGGGAAPAVGARCGRRRVSPQTAPRRVWRNRERWIGLRRRRGRGRGVDRRPHRRLGRCGRWRGHCCRCRRRLGGGLPPRQRPGATPSSSPPPAAAAAAPANSRLTSLTLPTDVRRSTVDAFARGVRPPSSGWGSPHSRARRRPRSCRWQPSRRWWTWTCSGVGVPWT